MTLAASTCRQRLVVTASPTMSAGSAFVRSPPTSVFLRRLPISGRHEVPHGSPAPFACITEISAVRRDWYEQWLSALEQ